MENQYKLLKPEEKISFIKDYYNEGYTDKFISKLMKIPIVIVRWVFKEIKNGI